MIQKVITRQILEKNPERSGSVFQKSSLGQPAWMTAPSFGFFQGFANRGSATVLDLISSDRDGSRSQQLAEMVKI